MDPRSGNAHLSNERLEFLGDAVLSLVIGDYLYDKYPSKDEGFLSQLRAKVVNREFFNQLGFKLGLDVWLKEHYAKGQETDIVPSMVGNAFEALFGAIFLDKDYKKAKRFFEKVILIYHLDIDSIKKEDSNYKSRLLEWGQKHNRIIEFQLTQTHKEGNNFLFIIEARVDGETLGEGRGLKKKKAEQQAAKQVLISFGQKV